MERPSDLGHLQTGDWNYIQEQADRFEEAWRRDGAADLAAFLPAPDHPLRALVLQELIKSDLEIRWRRGQGWVLEDYLREFPELGTTATLPVRLVYEEFRVRALFGDRPEMEHYRGRFPELFEQLRRLLHDEPLPTLSRPAQTPESPPAAPQGSPPGPMNISSGSSVPGGGGFKTIRRIGTGGFGEVWLGEAPGGVQVAIKIIFRSLDHEEAQRELRSLELIKNLRHSYLLETQQFWAFEDRLYIVMQLAEKSLRDRYKECRLQGMSGIPLPELITYFRESAEAIDFLHSEHVLHRDIKPDNILLLKKHAKVADFGLARAQQQSMASVSGSGTPAYMAPEVWKGKACEQSDGYALALTYVEMRLGRRPFASTDYAGVMFDHLETPPDLGNLSEAEQQVLRKALAKNPDARFGSCMEFIGALEDALAEQLRRPSAAISAVAAQATIPPTSGPPPGAGATGKSPAELKTDREGAPAGGSPFGTLAGPKRLAEEEAEAGDTDVELVPPRPPSKPEASRKQLLLAVVGLAAVLGVAIGGIIAYSRLGPSATTGPASKDRPEAGTFILKPLTAEKLSVGETRTIDIEVERDHFNQPIELTFHDLPRGVTIEPAAIPGDEVRTKARLVISEEVAKGVYRIMVHARSGDESKETPLELSVERLEVPLLAGWEKGPGARIERVDGKLFYNRIVLNRHGLKVPFILVPPRQPDDPPAFYIMENKVSNDQFARWADKELDPKKTEWRLGGRKNGMNQTPPLGSLPVLRVTVDEAHGFADWLGGALPTCRQWDQAAGYRQREGRQGPFKGPQVAINRVQDGPTPVGAMKDDESPLGVRDMAGNGREWTRNLAGHQGKAVVPFPALSDDLVILRGRMYTLPRPLHYSDLDYEQETPQTQYYRRASPYTSFRVVLEKLE